MSERSCRHEIGYSEGPGGGKLRALLLDLPVETRRARCCPERATSNAAVITTGLPASFGLDSGLHRVERLPEHARSSRPWRRSSGLGWRWLRSPPPPMRGRPATLRAASVASIEAACAVSRVRPTVAQLPKDHQSGIRYERVVYVRRTSFRTCAMVRPAPPSPDVRRLAHRDRFPRFPTVSGRAKPTPASASPFRPRRWLPGWAAH